ncbi:MAG: LamG domain-containing protein [Pirellulaceae bacterium]|nr:LamG domain-containing protein [Pirellulaceae bacterium]
MVFDPYYEWLGIPPEQQPANYYRVLGISDFEDSPRVIENAADQRMLHLRTFQLGAHARETQQLLNEISQARVCLLNADSKAAYDEELKEVNSDQWLPTTVQNSRPLMLVLVAATALVVVVFVLCFGLGVRMFSARARQPADSEVGVVTKPRSASKKSADEPMEANPPTKREQPLSSVLNDLNSSIVLRMTFDSETLTGQSGEKVVKDLSGHENHGEIRGATVVPGVKGEALEFQGQSYVDCGNATTLQPADAFSISVWVYPIKGADYPRIVSKELTYELRWQSYRGNTGPLRFEGGFGAVRAARTPPYEKWHHIVITFGRHSDGGVMRMYHNGALIAEQKPKSSKAGKPHGHLYLGVSGRNNRYEHYRGLLDELTILNREITANEVEAMYREIARTR